MHGRLFLFCCNMKILVKVSLPEQLQKNNKEVVYFSRMLEYVDSVEFPFARIYTSLDVLFGSVPHVINFTIY